MGRPRKSPIQNGFVSQYDFAAGEFADVPYYRVPENAGAQVQNMLMDQPGKLRRIGSYQNYSSVNAGANGLVGIYCPVYPVSGTAGIVLAVDEQATPHIWRYTT